MNDNFQNSTNISSPSGGKGAKYFIIVGERSGDLHGSNLIKAIKNADNEAVIMAWGGDMMAGAGAIILKHYRELAFMGFMEVIKNLPKILGFITECKKQIINFQPDCIILIDYAGFNMRIMKWAKQHIFPHKNPKIFYYISPKVWAWNQKRALKLKKYVDRLFVIFPFEVDFFKQYKYEVEFVGNPLFDAIANFQPNPNFLEIHSLENKKIIALLPGSRKQEVESCLTKMVATKKYFPDYQYVIAGVSNLPKEVYQQFCEENIQVIFDETYDLLNNAYAAMVTSGTATLETGLFKVPQVVVYQVNPVTYGVGKLVVKIKFMSLINLIAQKKVVAELLQKDFNIENLSKELKFITENSVLREQQLFDYQTVKESLGTVGASEKTGKRIVEILSRSDL